MLPTNSQHSNSTLTTWNHLKRMASASTFVTATALRASVARYCYLIQSCIKFHRSSNELTFNISSKFLSFFSYMKEGGELWIWVESQFLSTSSELFWTRCSSDLIRPWVLQIRSSFCGPWFSCITFSPWTRFVVDFVLFILILRFVSEMN